MGDSVANSQQLVASLITPITCYRLLATFAFANSNPGDAVTVAAFVDSCRLKNSRKIAPKINSSINSATASEKTIPAATTEIAIMLPIKSSVPVIQLLDEDEVEVACVVLASAVETAAA